MNSIFAHKREQLNRNSVLRTGGVWCTGRKGFRETITLPPRLYSLKGRTGLGCWDVGVSGPVRPPVGRTSGFGTHSTPSDPSPSVTDLRPKSAVLKSGPFYERPSSWVRSSVEVTPPFFPICIPYSATGTNPSTSRSFYPV